MLILCSILFFLLFGAAAFCVFYYAKNVIAGIGVISIPILFAAIVLRHIKDMEHAYIELRDHEIHVVDYYWGIKKEKHFALSDITSAEIHPGYSHKVKGYRHSGAGMRYIVFKNGDTYLFKVIALPETEEIFRQYMVQTH